MILSILYFFLTTLLLGTVVDFFVKDWKADFFERMVVRYGVGLAFMSVLGVLLVLLGIPLLWWIFFLLGMLIGVGAYFRNKGFCDIGASSITSARLFATLRTKRFWYALIILILFLLSANMYIGGSFSYNWFEDADPWGYAGVSRYIAGEHTFHAPLKFSHYAEPYAQGYQIVMGMLNQTNPSTYWVLKFFTNLVIASSILFAYTFARRFMLARGGQRKQIDQSGEKEKSSGAHEEGALLVALFLFAAPAWLSHFVFSLNYNMALIPVFLYALIMIGDKAKTVVTETATEKTKKKEKTKKRTGKKSLVSNFHVDGFDGWMIVTALLYAALWINHFYTAALVTILVALYWLDRVIIDAELHENILGAGLFGLLLAILLYYLPAYVRHWDLVVPGTVGFGGVENLFPLMLFLVTPLGIALLIVVIAALALLYKFRVPLFAPVAGFLKTPRNKFLTCITTLVLAIIIFLLPVKFLNILGTASRDYTLRDFFVATSSTMINNPVGIGFVIMLLFCAGLIITLFNLKKLLSPRNTWVAVAFSWAVATLLLVNGTRLSIAISPFRLWPFFALACAFLAAFAVMKLLENLSNPVAFFAVLLIIAALVIPTSFLAKQELNSLPWGESVIVVPESRAAYAWLRDNAPNAVTARLCGDSWFLPGYDQNTALLLREGFNPLATTAPGSVLYHDVALDYTIDENKEFYRANGVEYLVAGASCAVGLSQEAAQEKLPLLQARINEMIDDPEYEPVFSTESEVVFRLH